LVYPLTGVLWCDNGYYGNDILRFSGISTISTNSHVNSKNESSFITKLFDISFLKDPVYANFIAKLGIKYILIRKLACEVDTGTGNIHDLSDMLKKVGEQINKMSFRKIMENADYSLFELTGNERPGYISLVRAVFPLENESTTIKKINFFNTTSNYNNLFSQQQQFQPKYQKISSSEYRIKIENITKPFYIMFAVSYDQGWKAFINGKEQIPEKYHLIVDDFANGWYVNSSKNNTEHELNIKLYYEPQKYYELGLIVYAIIVCTCLILLSHSERRKIIHFIKGLRKERNLLNGKSSM
jgi:membrane protein YfhO